MAELRVSAPALDELEQALAWYAARNPNAASRFAQAAEAAFDAIEAHPERPPLQRGKYRCVLLDRFPYIVVYRWSGNVALVVAVRHTSRDNADLLD